MAIKEDVVIGSRTKIWHPETSNIYGAVIGNDCNIGALVEIRKDVIIGNNCKIQAFTFIPEGIRIGNNVFIGPHVCFTNDKYPKAQGDWQQLYTYVEDDVSVGAGAVILPGLRIGKGAVIGAGSVVTRSVFPGHTVKGNPAR